MIHYDNQSCIRLSKNPFFHNRSKPVDIKYNFIRDCVQRGTVQLRYVPTDQQVPDILTKAMRKTGFIFFRYKLGVMQHTFLTNREC